MRPEWLPLPGDDPPVENFPAILLAFYDDDLGELCAGIAGTLSQRHADVRIAVYDAVTLARNFVAASESIQIAHVSVTDFAHAYVARFVQIRVDRVTGRLDWIDRHGMLEKTAHDPGTLR